MSAGSTIATITRAAGYSSRIWDLPRAGGVATRRCSLSCALAKPRFQSNEWLGTDQVERRLEKREYGWRSRRATKEPYGSFHKNCNTIGVTHGEEKGTDPFCAQHPAGRSGKRGRSLFLSEHSRSVSVFLERSIQLGSMQLDAKGDARCVFHALCGVQGVLRRA